MSDVALLVVNIVLTLVVYAFFLWGGVEIAVWDKGRTWRAGLICGFFTIPGLLILLWVVSTDWERKRAIWAEYSTRTGAHNPYLLQTSDLSGG